VKKMPKLKLVSDYVPRGDQPQAIEKLTEGLRKGYKFQTLLGITGSGKSVTGDTPAMIFTPDEPSGYTQHLVKIGEFIDKQLEDDEDLLRKVDDTLISYATEPYKYHVLSFNPRNCESDIKPITAFIRHEAPEYMYCVKFACGREIKVTSDHNLWILRNGELQLLPTDELVETDYIPIPLKIPFVDKDLLELNVWEIFRDEKLYVEANDLIKGIIEKYGQSTVKKVFAKYYKSAHTKLYFILQSKPGCRIPISIFSQIIKELSFPLTEDNLRSMQIVGRTKHSIPGLMRLTPNFLRLLGYYIAEGNCQDNYFILSNNSDEVRSDIYEILSDLGLPYTVRKNGDFQISQKVYRNLLCKIAGAKAQTKKLPEFCWQLSQKQLGELLRAYFEGDGGVEQSRVVCSTASRKLANDLTYAMLRFGIWARIRRIWKKAANSQHKGDWYWEVSISSQRNLQAFAKHIGFISARKNKALNRQLLKSSDTNVDVLPNCGDRIRTARKKAGLYMRQLAAASELSQGAISMIEAEKRYPKRETVSKFISCLESQSFDETTLEEDIFPLKKLLSVRWTKIDSIEKVKCEEEYVYDFSVADNETFLAGMGGIFVHNTFTMANIIANVQRPTLVISHNKTLAAQLYSEFREFFPNNAVHYFVSFYDWYMPEAYKPQTDTYIEKDTRINEEINRLRMAATASLMSRKDVIIVASVSCIYGIGSPEQFQAQRVQLKVGDIVKRNDILRALVDIRYERNDIDFARGRFRARGDVVEVFPAYSETAYRIELFGDDVDRITEIDTLTGEILNEHNEIEIFPARHYMTDEERFEQALLDIEAELQERIDYFISENKLLEAQRTEQRTRFDLEMMREVGYCMGIENYSRHLSGLKPGEPPHCLINFYPDDFLIFIDESHVTIPQIRGMYRGDRSRKRTLVDYGFRLPSALDNRPLQYEEFEKVINQAIFVSATPAEFERELSLQHGQIVEQIIRPTGLIDPKISVHPTEGQIDHLIGEINKRVEKKQRVLVLTMTKRMAEDLTDYLQDAGIRTTYLHSEIETLERPQILRDLREAKFDVLVGINLLREGLDLPEVTLVVILDADRQGFLRTETSLIQMAGRAARNIDGEVILYANNITDAIRNAMRETQRRREIQMKYNEEHGITPTSIQKAIVDMLPSAAEESDWVSKSEAGTPEEMMLDKIKKEAAAENLQEIIDNLSQEMQEAATNLEFERAAALRDQIMELKQELGQ